MRVELEREFRFESAHRLPAVPAGHPCGRLHGHGYRVVVRVAGPVDPRLGWLIDFGDIDARFAPLHAALDHRVLNEVEGLDNPTAEHLARWIFDRLRADLPILESVTVWETARSAATYRGESGG